MRLPNLCVSSHLVGIMVTELHFGNIIIITELQVFFSCTINHTKKLIKGPKYIRGQHWDNISVGSSDPYRSIR